VTEVSFTPKLFAMVIRAIHQLGAGPQQESAGNGCSVGRPGGQICGISGARLLDKAGEITERRPHVQFVIAYVHRD
jgi:hypothetical protein